MVGREVFTFGGTRRHRAEIEIKPVGFKSYLYTLYIDGAPYADFLEFERAQEPLLNVGSPSHQNYLTDPETDVSTAL